MKTRNKRGGILITTVILAMGVSIALGSFIALSVRSSKLSNSSFNFNSALNLAEAGIEKAMTSINIDDWSDWATYQGNAANKIRTISGIDLGSGVTGSFDVVVFGATWAANPRVVSEGRTFGNLGSTVRKQIDVRLRRRSLYATGIVAKDQIVFSGGNVAVDSYDSTNPAYSTDGQYDPAKLKDGGTVASVSVVTDVVNISNGDVWGYVATGGSAPKAGPNGTILGEDSDAGVKIDPDRVATDFTANFDPVDEPTSGFDIGALAMAALPGISTDFTLLGPRGVTMKYPEDPTTYTLYKVANIGIAAAEVLKIEGNVVLLVTGDTDVKGTLDVSRALLDPTDPTSVRVDSSLLMFARGDVTVGGNGLVNETARPGNLEIRGSNTTLGGQTIKLNGNGAMQACVYAPNAHVELVGGGGGGEWMGSVVGADVKITGNYKFHYDESLADKNDGNPFMVALWREILDPAAMISF